MGIDFQNIFDILQNIISCKWDKIAFYAGYFEGGYTMKFYLKNDGNYRDCFSILNEDEITSAFSDIDDVLLQARENLPTENNWTVFTMIVDKEGAMKSAFDYEDISSDSEEYFSRWKEKYLN